MKKIATTIAIAFAVSLTGCGSNDKPGSSKAAEKQAAEQPLRYRPEDFASKTFAILSGSSFDAVAREIIGVKLCKYYDTPSQAVEAVRKGEADAMLLEEPVGRKFAAQFPELVTLQPPVDIENYAVLFPKSDNGKLRDEFNVFLREQRSNGVIDDMEKRWVDMPESPPMPKIVFNPTKNKKLVFATSDCDPPFSFKNADGEMEGFDVELARRFAKHGGYDLEILVMDFPDIIPAIQSGRLDFASNLITITDERMTIVDFSEPVYYGGTVVLTRKP